jgi:hypothetical protein
MEGTFIQPFVVRRHGNTSGCTRSPSITASSRSQLYGAVDIFSQTSASSIASISQQLIMARTVVLPFRIDCSSAAFPTLEKVKPDRLGSLTCVNPLRRSSLILLSESRARSKEL